ncbi:MAG: hypothetical protein ABI222_14620 [Opitutaceae bacterium]
MKLPRLLLLCIATSLATRVSAADVFERYLDVIGIREQHNGMLVAGFDTARMLAEKNGAPPKSPSEEANLKRVKEIMLEEAGFDAVRVDYLAEIHRVFTQEELSAVIDDLEKPAVAAVLRRQGEAFATMLVKIQVMTLAPKIDQAKKRISREVLHR